MTHSVYLFNTWAAVPVYHAYGRIKDFSDGTLDRPSAQTVAQTVRVPQPLARPFDFGREGRAG